MGSINNLVGSDQDLQEIIDERIENIELWLRKLEKARPKNFSKNLYDSIKDYTYQSYYLDFKQINDAEFFEQLKPRIRHRLVNQLFRNFIANFFYMFNDAEFEAGCEFTSNFLCNVYSRLYLPENVIISQGDKFECLMMIHQGCVSMQLKLGHDDNSEHEFFILPTYSYFGDYQLLFDLKSQVIYRGKENKLMITLCLDKKIFLELMEEYPEARKLYVERAWLRRIEMRRRQKKFIKELIEKVDLNLQYIEKVVKDECEDSSSHDNDSETSSSGSCVDSSYSEKQKALKKKKSLITDAINKKISKFYVNVKTDTELNEDFDSDELQNYSEDEIEPVVVDMLKEDNKKISYEHAQ